MDGYWSL